VDLPLARPLAIGTYASLGQSASAFATRSPIPIFDTSASISLRSASVTAATSSLNRSAMVSSAPTSAATRLSSRSAASAGAAIQTH
jgi:hypothetical protein